MKRLLILFTAFMVAGAASSPVKAQSCRTSSDTATHVIVILKSALTTVDSARLASVGLLPATESQILLVTTDSLCSLAVAAYNTNAPTDSTNAITSVYLVKAGPSRYVAFVPSFRSGEFIDLLIFDTSFVYKGQFVG